MPILLTNRRKHPRVSNAWAQNFCERLLVALKKPGAQLSVTLCGDEEIQAINRTWRQRDKPTDVLSFSQIEGETPWSQTASWPQGIDSPMPELLGDIVISLDTALRQAEALGHSLTVEVGRLLIHGAVHLLGHDHIHGGKEAERMYRVESRLMRALNIPLKP